MPDPVYDLVAYWPVDVDQATADDGG